MSRKRIEELCAAVENGSARAEDVKELAGLAKETAEYAAKLETACIEIVALRDEAADDPTTIINRALQKLDTEIVQMSVLLP